MALRFKRYRAFKAQLGRYPYLLAGDCFSLNFRVLFFGTRGTPFQEYVGFCCIREI